MSRRNNSLGAVLGSSVGLALATMSLAVPASAHISLELGGTHMSRYGDGELKAGPCGKAGGTRGTNIYTYAPGQKITVTVVETITHPSYFRFAFDNDGDDAFIEPASIMPIDPARKCPDGPGDHCGASDFYNSPAVLPNMDNLNPHITAPTNTKYTWEVTLPSVECTNCTLQIIQVMEDDLAHGPYDPTPGVGVEDIYHQCIDIVLKASAGDGGTGGSSDAGAAGDGRPTPTTDARVTDTGAAGAPSDASRTPDANTGTGGSAGRGGSTGTDASTPPAIDAGGGSGGSGATGAGGSTGGTAGGPGSAGRGGSGASAGSGGSAGATAGTGPGGDGNGCSCTVVGARGSAGALAGWSLLALALASRRRRR